MILKSKPRAYLQFRFLYNFTEIFTCDWFLVISMLVEAPEFLLKSGLSSKCHWEKGAEGDFAGRFFDQL